MISTRATRLRIGSDHHKFKDHETEKRIFRRRAVFSVLVLVGMLVILLYRFYDLQISNFNSYSTQSDQNRIQVRPVVPNRGLIRDERGRILADNRAVSALTITHERVDDLDVAIGKLKEIVNISEREIKNFYKSLRLRRRPYEAVPLKFNLTDTELAKFAVREYEFDGVDVRGQLVRFYPYGDLFTHVIGYVGRINEREQSAFDEEQVYQYAGTRTIGKIGIEKYYEGMLHGEVGQEKIETDARGRILRVVETDDPVAGKNLDLFLNVDVQIAAQKAMDGRRGAIVALDIQTGGVVAFLSSPSYDPNLFVTGISEKKYSVLNTSSDLPLFNRVIQGQYPPGSTVKPVLGLGGLETGIISEFTRVPDPGYYQLENDDRLFRGWKKGGHGPDVDLHQAIVESVDVFYYDLGFKMGVDRMHEYGLHFGLGAATNIDVPSERSGLWPSREWKKRVRGLDWYPGNSLNMSIGQGDVLATPIQLAAMTSTIARRGTYVEPRLVKTINGEPVPKIIRSELSAVPENWDLIFRSMRDVVHAANGTAQSIDKNLSFMMAGKTGTAQVVSIAQDGEYDSEALSERNRDHALFVGFAPYENPQIAVAVVIENGEKSSEAGEVAKMVMSEYLVSGNYAKLH